MPLSKTDEHSPDRRSVVISQGEPSGIGPEISLKTWIRLKGEIAGRPIRLVGSSAHFRETASRIGCDFRVLESAIIDAGQPVKAEPGHPSPLNAPAVTAAIRLCVAACVDHKAAAMVTAPIQKSALTEAGFGFPGHTEFLAALTGVKRAVMMLASSAIDPPLRVIPYTIHIPLREVLQQLNEAAISATARVVLASLLADFGIPKARLAIAGVNPHAGEKGTIGREELDIIVPAITKLREEGHRVHGPLAADSLFHDAARREYDAVLCMFHDQALIPIKTLDFRSGVNVTLGLPIVRTSPDHGTALDIAGNGIADESSMVAAVTMAAEIATRRGL
jgi:4-hydroxythreonine-4-phosphate dehydrogenase